MSTALLYPASLSRIRIMLTKPQFSKKVGENIRKIRKQKGVSQENLAYEAGLYRTYVGHLENGRYSPSAYILYRIAKVLKVDASEFFPG